MSPHLLCSCRCWAYTTRWTLRHLLRLAVSPRTWSRSLSCTMLGGPPKWSSSPTWWWNPASAAERHPGPPKAKRETVSTHSPDPRPTQEELGVRDYTCRGLSAKPCGLGSGSPWGFLLEHFLVLLAVSCSFWELLWWCEDHTLQNGWAVGTEEKDRVEKLLCIWMLGSWAGESKGMRKSRWKGEWKWRDVFFYSSFSGLRTSALPPGLKVSSVWRNPESFFGERKCTNKGSCWEKKCSDTDFSSSELWSRSPATKTVSAKPVSSVGRSWLLVSKCKLQGSQPAC